MPLAFETRSATAYRPRRAGRANVDGHLHDNRFDRRLAGVLEHAARIFCEKGYEGASMRDLARSSGMSLSGLYYYFESKEKLLYLIQRHTFTTILERLKQRLHLNRTRRQFRPPSQQLFRTRAASSKAACESCWWKMTR